MSLPAIFFTASDTEAQTMELNHTLPADDVAELGSINTLHLSILAAVLDGREWDDSMMDAFDSLKSTDSEWIDRIPAQLTQKIANLDGAELNRVSTEWAATEEMRCQPDEAREVLLEIAPVARRALATHRGFYLYTCL